MQQENSKLHCEFHPKNELQIIHFGEKPKRKTRLLCSSCLIESNNERENLCQFVQINDFVIDPKNTILKIINIDKQGQQNIFKILDEMDKVMLQLEESIKNQLIKIKENIQKMRKQVQQIGEELSNELKLRDVVKQIQLLKQMDSCQGTSELTNLESQLNFISENLNKSYFNANKKSIDNQLKTAQTLLDNLKIIKKDLESTTKNFIGNLENVNLYSGVLTDIQDFPQIHQQISEGKKIYYQLLYSSATDGLNIQAYWAKCDMQQNLLTIMTSKNGSKFGGYSPCQINQKLNNYVQDPTMKSFIFQYNKKELYKLKHKEHAVICSPDYGPVYGQFDIQVNADLQNGYSQQLGTTYDISSYNIVDKANHIFGAATPQLQELKVYKVIFI